MKIKIYQYSQQLKFLFFSIIYLSWPSNTIVKLLFGYSYDYTLQHLMILIVNPSTHIIVFVSAECTSDTS